MPKRYVRLPVKAEASTTRPVVQNACWLCIGVEVVVWDCHRLLCAILLLHVREARKAEVAVAKGLLPAMMVAEVGGF